VVGAYIKNDGLNFSIPHLHNGKPSEYLPDYVIRLAGEDDRFLIAEMKGADWGGLTDVKAQAAHRWCAAVNARASSAGGTTGWHSAFGSLPHNWTRWRRNTCSRARCLSARPCSVSPETHRAGAQFARASSHAETALSARSGLVVAELITVAMIGCRDTEERARCTARFCSC
jgi:hypothetical protein